MLVSAMEDLTQPREVRATYRRQARRASPYLRLVGARFNKDDVDTESIKFLRYRFGPALKGPFRGAIDRVCGLTYKARLA